MGIQLNILWISASGPKKYIIWAFSDMFIFIQSGFVGKPLYCKWNITSEFAKIQSWSKLKWKTYEFLCISNILWLKQNFVNKKYKNLFGVYGGIVLSKIKWCAWQTKCNGSTRTSLGAKLHENEVSQSPLSTEEDILGRNPWKHSSNQS